MVSLKQSVGSLAGLLCSDRFSVLTTRGLYPEFILATELWVDGRTTSAVPIDDLVGVYLRSDSGRRNDDVNDAIWMSVEIETRFVVSIFGQLPPRHLCVRWVLEDATYRPAIPALCPVGMNTSRREQYKFKSTHTRGLCFVLLAATGDKPRL